MLTLRVYVVDSSTGDRRELGTEEYEPSGSLPVLRVISLPPCRCAKCDPTGPAASRRDDGVDPRGGGTLV